MKKLNNLKLYEEYKELSDPGIIKIRIDELDNLIKPGKKPWLILTMEEEEGNGLEFWDIDNEFLADKIEDSILRQNVVLVTRPLKDIPESTLYQCNIVRLTEPELKLDRVDGKMNMFILK